MASSYAIICSRDDATDEYERLKLAGLLNIELKPMPYGDKIAIPIIEGDFILEFEKIEKNNPHVLLSKLIPNPPKKWEMLGDMIIFQQGTDTSGWPLEDIAKALNGERIAIQSEIDPGIERKSRLELVYGDNGWVEHRENFVDYVFDATAVMFSSGNVTERRRMGQIDTTNETIVDAYCGIGYYTLQFLARGGASHVHACEINPESINALKKGLNKNQVTDKCTIHEGDNRQTMKMLKGVADRVILGLIPSSMNTWGLAINCLKDSGGVIHVHMNVHCDEIDEWVAKTTEWFATVSGKNVTALHVENVKKYSPYIQHIVLDLEFN